MDKMEAHIKNRIGEYLLDGYNAGKNDCEFDIKEKTKELYEFCEANIKGD